MYESERCFDQLDDGLQKPGGGEGVGDAVIDRERQRNGEPGNHLAVRDYGPRGDVPDGEDGFLPGVQDALETVNAEGAKIDHGDASGFEARVLLDGDGDCFAEDFVTGDASSVGVDMEGEGP